MNSTEPRTPPPSAASTSTPAPTSTPTPALTAAPSSTDSNDAAATPPPPARSPPPPTGQATAEHHQDAVEPELEAALRSIDLRTIKLPDRTPRAGIERAIHDALGITRRPGPDVPLPPLPGHGIDGPDLGL